MSNTWAEVNITKYKFAWTNKSEIMTRDFQKSIIILLKLKGENLDKSYMG